MGNFSSERDSLSFFNLDIIHKISQKRSRLKRVEKDKNRENNDNDYSMESGHASNGLPRPRANWVSLEDSGISSAGKSILLLLVYIFVVVVIIIVVAVYFTLNLRSEYMWKLVVCAVCNHAEMSSPSAPPPELFLF